MELRNIFELILPFCHVPSGLVNLRHQCGGLMPQVPVTCHLAVPTNLFHSWWPFLLQPADLGPGYTVGESALTQAFLRAQRF